MTMMGRRRKHPRYPYRAPVALRVAGSSAFETEHAVDIGLGGIFVATDTPPPLLTEGTLAVRKVEGGSCLLPVQVVRVITKNMARGGYEAGIGLEFGELTSRQRAVVEQLVAHASQQDPRRRIPCLTAAGKQASSQDPMLAYVMDAIDGRRSPEQLAHATGLAEDALIEMLRVLWSQGLVQFAGAEPSQGHSAPELGASRDRERTAAPQGRCDLSPDERSKIDAFHARAASDDHYEVLMLDPSADADRIGRAFAALLRRYHPDAYKQRALGSYRATLEGICERLRAAYVVLGRPESRAEYDRHYERPEADAPPVKRRRSSQPRKARADELKASLRRSGVALRAIPHPEQPRPQTPAQPTTAGPRPTQATLVGTGEGACLVTRCLDEAEQAVAAGDFSVAARALDLVRCMDHEDDQWRPRHDALYRKVAVHTADDSERKATYAQRQQQWQKASRLWSRVCDGRPDDATAHRQTAHCLLEAGDTRRAYRYATRAVELDDDCADNHQVLGNALLAAGLKLRARTALEQAASLREPPRTSRAFQFARTLRRSAVAG